MPTETRIDSRHVVVVGGGIAALEAVLALHDLGRGALQITLVAPEDRFVLRPLTVREPFGGPAAPSLPLAEFMADHGGRFVRDRVVSIDADAGHVVCADEGEIAFDELLLVPGAPTRAAYEHALTFDGKPEMLAGLVADVEEGYARSVAFVVPPGVSWPLPLYELALMSAEQAWGMGIDDFEITIVTPEATPLALFGAVASRELGELLHVAGIRFVGGVEAEVLPGRVLLGAGRPPLVAARVVALPVLDGPRLPGVPSDGGGFIPIDDHARVRGLDHVYAAGDATDLPVKQGGVACQTADVAASDIARRAGAHVRVDALRPVLRGRLLTGRGDRFLHRDPGTWKGKLSEEPLWWPPAKVASRYLAPFLAGTPATGARGELPPGIDVEIPVYVPAAFAPDELALDPYGPLSAR